MSGIELAVAASAAMSAGGAVASALGAQREASANRQAIALRQEQLALQREQLEVERDTLALSARDQEVERRRRARYLDSATLNQAVAQGLDPAGYGTVGVVQAENRRALEEDLAALRLGAKSAALNNTIRMRQAALDERSLRLQSAAWSMYGQNAWLRAGFQIGNSLLGAWRAGGGGQSAPSKPRSGFAAGIGGREN